MKVGIQMKYTTGNAIVDEIGSMSFSGNVVPHIWYKTITRENGRPNLLAISILSDIVYWYRPVEIRDEITGQLMGFRKRFCQDLLQRNYDQIAEMFGESKRAVTEAVIRLEKLGVVRRVFRTVEKNGIKCSNVLFLELIPSGLYQVTFPTDENQKIQERNAYLKKGSSKEERYSREEEKAEDISDIAETEEYRTTVSDGGIPEKWDTYHGIMGEVSRNNGRGLTEKRETNTEIITENTTEIISSSIQQGRYPNQGYCKDDDDKDYNDLLKQRIGYHLALQMYPVELVDMVFYELKKRQKGLDQLYQCIGRNTLHVVCQNIIQYSGKIHNTQAYICKCLDNLIDGQRIYRSCRKKQSVARHGFEMQEYDFEDLERTLTENL